MEAHGVGIPEPSTKKRRLSLSLRKDRFGTSTSSEVESACKGFTPKSTERCTEWALRVLHAWRNQRNSEGEKCPEDLFENPTVELLNQWLPVFVIEARRENGERYPAATINQLLAGLWRAARAKSPECPNFLSLLFCHAV